MNNVMITTDSVVNKIYSQLKEAIFGKFHIPGTS